MEPTVNALACVTVTNLAFMAVDVSPVFDAADVKDMTIINHTEGDPVVTTAGDSPPV